MGNKLAFIPSFAGPARSGRRLAGFSRGKGLTDSQKTWKLALFMEPKTCYAFHPHLELSQCAGGVLAGYILGNKISLFEESLDENFADFIVQRLKDKKPFSAKDMAQFFAGGGKSYNLGKIIQGLKSQGLISPADTKSADLILVNLTDISKDKLLAVAKEACLESRLKIIDGLGQKSPSGLYERINAKGQDQVIFVLSDLSRKYKVSELNLHFVKKAVCWAPIITDALGGYIGPLLRSSPCFACYEENMYKPDERLDKNAVPPVILNIFLRQAFLEAFKIGGGLAPSPAVYSNFIELDCLNSRSRKHYIYSNSSCSVCGG